MVTVSEKRILRVKIDIFQVSAAASYPSYRRVDMLFQKILNFVSHIFNLLGSNFHFDEMGESRTVSFVLSNGGRWAKYKKS